MGINLTNYTLVGVPPYTSLTMFNVQGDGQLDDCSLSTDGKDTRNIVGKYDEASGELSFNDAEIAGLRIGTTFFDGHAISDGQGAPSFSGTWNKVVYTKSNAPPPPGKIGTIFVTHLNGQWAAFNPTPIIP